MSFETTALSAAGDASGPLSWRRAWLNIDKNERAIKFAQSGIGIATLHIAFVALLGLSLQLSMAGLAIIATTLVLIAALPRYKLAIITSSSVFYVVMRPFRIPEWTNLTNLLATSKAVAIDPLILQIGSVALFLVMAMLFLGWQRQNMSHPAAKRPVLTLVLLWFGLFCTGMASSPGTLTHAVLWTVTGVSISSLWFLAYAAIDQKGKDTTPFAARAMFMRPFWGGSAAPIGKSYGYLNKFAAKDEKELAITRLKAVKLAVWAVMLKGLWVLLELLIHQEMSIPPLHDAIMAHAGGISHATHLNWASVLANYFIDLVIISVWGHLIVATIRMAGWRIPRNTVNPLAARSLAEFWNRYFFYFKEMLVDLFFYPAFLRYFKKNAKLRVAFATLCAAGLGNFLYHFMRETYQFATKPVMEALSVFPSAVFYSLVLAAGLILSQLRNRKPKPEDGFLSYHVLPRLNVMAFFCFLKIFDDISGEGSLAERLSFTTNLFGV